MNVSLGDATCSPPLLWPLVFFCFSATDETHVESPAVTTTNVWKEREEFYRSAMPKDENDENHMLQRALEESQQQQHDESREPWDIDLSPQL